jgi:hypothetical protein
MSSRVAADSLVRLGSERRELEMTDRVPGLSLVRLDALTNRFKSSPAQTERAARPSTSGRRPCPMRVSVDGLTPLSSPTCLQESRRLTRSASKAA